MRRLTSLRRCVGPALVAPLALFALTTSGATPAAAQSGVAGDTAMLRRLFASREFTGESAGRLRWLDGGSYTVLERTSDGSASEIVRYDAATGHHDVLVPAARLVPAGASAPLAVEDYVISNDRTHVLLFTNSRKVWRANTRGDYWVLDLRSGALHKLGRSAAGRPRSCSPSSRPSAPRGLRAR